MAQYFVGTVSVTNSSTAVVGTDTLWLASVAAGDWFMVVGDGIVYQVASVTDDTNLVLTQPYAGLTSATATYTINTDFTPNWSLPLLSRGDRETATIFTRAMTDIDSTLSDYVASGSALEAEHWANYPEDLNVPESTGSPLEYSSKHYSKKSEAFSILTAADAAAALVSENNAEDWATLTGALVEATDYSSKEYAIGTTVPSGSAKEWSMTIEDTLVDGVSYSALHYSAKANTSATNAATSESNAEDWASLTGALVLSTDYSAKEYAIGTFVPEGSAKDWATAPEDTNVTGGSPADYSALHHAGKAAASASAAGTSETNAAASYDQFDDRYLGSKASDPALDNDGNALLTGALYWNTAGSPTGVLKAYDGADWVEASLSGANFYNKTQSDSNFAPIDRGVRRNLIINGCFRVAQRNTTFAAVTNGSYTLDRWETAKSTAGVCTVNQTAITNRPFAFYYLIDVTTADASIAAGDFWATVSALEGYDVEHLDFGSANAKSITLSFWHNHTKTGTHCVAIRNGAANRSYVAEYTQSVTNTWEQTTITIPGDTSGTWLKDDGIGLSLVFTTVGGSTFQTTAGAWAAGNFFSTSNQVNNLDSTANFMRFAQVQLEVGSEKTDFAHRSFAEELAMCKEYYEQFQPTDGVAVATMGGRSTSLISGTLNYLPKRTVPTITHDTVTADWNIQGVAGESLSTLAFTAGIESASIDWTDSGTPFTANNAYILVGGATPTTGNVISIDAEL